MPSFLHVLASLRNASRQSRPMSLWVPPLTWRLVTWQRMSFFDPLVCSGISGRSSTISSSSLLACSRCSRRSSVTKPVGLQVGIDPPDQPADMLLGDTLVVSGRLQFVHQALGVNPTESVLADVELPR